MSDNHKHDPVGWRNAHPELSPLDQDGNLTRDNYIKWCVAYLIEVRGASKKVAEKVAGDRFFHLKGLQKIYKKRQKK